MVCQVTKAQFLIEKKIFGKKIYYVCVVERRELIRVKAFFTLLPGHPNISLDPAKLFAKKCLQQ